MERRDFFISYTKRDKERAVWIARVLQNNGYTLYMQEMDIFPGDSFLTKMNYFLENSENFIAVWSKSYNNSYYGMMELEAAVTAKMRIIFCCVDERPVLKLYRRLVHVALPDMDAASEATLADAVRRAVPRPAPETESPKPEPPKPPKRKPSKPVSGKSRKVWLYLIGLCFVIALAFAGAHGIQTLSGEWHYKLGNDYYYGRNVTQDYAKAREYYEQAAAKGNADALNHLGILYQDGLGVDVDYAKAQDYYERAAAKGNASALNRLGWLYQYGFKDYAKARDYYEQAAAKGNADALYNLGLLYEYGIGVDIDYEKALDYYQQAADAGHEKAPATVEEMQEKLNNSTE